RLFDSLVLGDIEILPGPYAGFPVVLRLTIFLRPRTNRVALEEARRHAAIDDRLAASREIAGERVERRQAPCALPFLPQFPLICPPPSPIVVVGRRIPQPLRLVPDEPVLGQLARQECAVARAGG